MAGTGTPARGRNRLRLFPPFAEIGVAGAVVLAITITGCAPSPSGIASPEIRSSNPTSAGAQTNPNLTDTPPASGGAAKTSATDANPVRSPNTVTIVGAGSGFAVGATGVFATAFHVVDGCQGTFVHYSGRSRPAEILKTDQTHDLALLRSEPLGEPSPSLSAIDAPIDQASTYAIGFPDAKIRSPIGVQGFIQGTRSLFGFKGGASLHNVLELITDAPIRNGVSGGPLLTRSGLVIGIVTARFQTIGNYAYAIPISRLHGLIAEAGLTAEVATHPNPVAMGGLRLTTGNAAAFARGFTVAILCTGSVSPVGR